MSPNCTICLIICRALLLKNTYHLSRFAISILWSKDKGLSLIFFCVNYFSVYYLQQCNRKWHFCLHFLHSYVNQDLEDLLVLARLLLEKISLSVCSVWLNWKVKSWLTDLMRQVDFLTTWFWYKMSNFKSGLKCKQMSSDRPLIGTILSPHKYTMTFM